MKILDFDSYMKNKNEQLVEKISIKELFSKGKDLTSKFIKNISIATKRESLETVRAMKILASLIRGEEVKDADIKFLKSQSVDIAKIIGLLGISLVSSAIPVLIDKILKPKGINIFPDSHLQVD